nr:amino acid permease 6-like [Tanacetum cinerariifolium]
MKTPADENVLSYQKFVKFALDETKLSTKSLVPSYLQEEFGNLKEVNGKTKLKMCSFQAPKIRLLRSLSIESSDGYTEINSTIKQTNEKATTIGILASTVFYMLCGVLVYIAFGNAAPGYFLIGFGFHDPFWLIDVVNVCIVIHLLGAYQVKGNKEKDKIRAKTRQNQEQTGNVKKSKVKPDKVKGQSKPRKHQMEENTTLRTKIAKS